jgi:hypothetical protein
VQEDIATSRKLNFFLKNIWSTGFRGIQMALNKKNFSNALAGLSIAIFLEGCSSLPRNPNKDNAVETGGDNGRLVCSGHLRLTVPSDWTLGPNESGTGGKGSHGEDVQLESLRRPNSSLPSQWKNAEDTLHEFTSGSEKLTAETSGSDDYKRFRRFSSMITSSEFPTAWNGGSFIDTKDNTNNYSIEYLLAEPNIVHMFTIEKDKVNFDDFKRYQIKYDAIVKAAKWSEEILYADSPDCE